MQETRPYHRPHRFEPSAWALAGRILTTIGSRPSIVPATQTPDRHNLSCASRLHLSCWTLDFHHKPQASSPKWLKLPIHFQAEAKATLAMADRPSSGPEGTVPRIIYYCYFSSFSSPLPFLSSLYSPPHHPTFFRRQALVCVLSLTTKSTSHSF
jgi:hypothetical protein